MIKLKEIVNIFKNLRKRYYYEVEILANYENEEKYHYFKYDVSTSYRLEKKHKDIYLCDIVNIELRNAIRKDINKKIWSEVLSVIIIDIKYIGRKPYDNFKEI